MSTKLASANWFKSTRSQADAECVEVAFLDAGEVGLRDSKNPAGPALIFTPTAWDSFTAAISEGEFTRR